MAAGLAFSRHGSEYVPCSPTVSAAATAAAAASTRHGEHVGEVVVADAGYPERPLQYVHLRASIPHQDVLPTGSGYDDGDGSSRTSIDDGNAEDA